VLVNPNERVPLTRLLTFLSMVNKLRTPDRHR